MITILNGSPNKSSMTLALSEQFLKHTKEDFQLFHTYDLNIHSCDDCKFCNHKLGCNKVDDMESIYQALKQTDTLIVSSPIYFGAFSDALMKVINRFQRYYAQRFVHKEKLNLPIKRLIVVTTAGSKEEKMFKGAHLTYEILVNLFQPSDHYFITASDTDHVSPINNKEVLKQIEEVKKKMVP